MKECKRMPGNEITLKFISGFMMKEHIQKWLDEVLKTLWGSYQLCEGILSGKVRLYGVFETREPMIFYGFEMVYLSGKDVVVHSFWDRGADTCGCIDMCHAACRSELEKEGIEAEYAVSHIPPQHRAARMLAKRMGMEYSGVRYDIHWRKGEYSFPCSEYRMKWKDEVK